MGLIFVSSPYSHEDPKIIEENYEKVAKFVSMLATKGLTAISPIVYGHNLLKYNDMANDWKTWEDFCLTFLHKADELWVYKMPGWNRSRGVAEEIEYAIKMNIPVKYVEYVK